MTEIVASLDDPNDLGGSLDAALLADLQQAADTWGTHIAGKGVLTSSLQFKNLAGTTLAEGAPVFYTSSGTTLDGNSQSPPSDPGEVLVQHDAERRS